MRHAGFAAAVLLSLAPVQLQAAGPFQFRQITPSSLELSEDGKPALVYNHGMILKEGVKEQYRRSSYIHPVFAPDGTVVTDDFPQDHPHHRGICGAGRLSSSKARPMMSGRSWGCISASSSGSRAASLRRVPNWPLKTAGSSANGKP